MTSKSNLFFGVIEAREPALGCIFESLLNCEIGLGRCEFYKIKKLKIFSFKNTSSRIIPGGRS